MKKNLLLCLSVLLLCLFISPDKALATHFVGSDFSYRAVPGQLNKYVLTVNFYRDCGGIPAPTFVAVTCFPTTTSLPSQLVILPVLDSIEVSEVCVGMATECSTPPGIVQGIKKYVYSDTVELGISMWRFSFYDCCRNAGIVNLNNSLSMGYYVDAYMSNFGGLVNNSPTFAASPAPYFCVNDTVTYTPQATDIDGDSLAYSFDMPYDYIAGSLNPIMIPFGGGFAPYQPFGTWVPVSLDSTTGIMEFIPTMAGAFVMVLKVQEWRMVNGVRHMVGQTRRDIQVQVLPCTTPCPMAGNNIGVNGTSQSGSQIVQTLANEQLQVQIPATSTNPNVTLTITSNCASEIPGSYFNVLGSGSNVTGVFNWTPEASHVSNTPYFFSFKVEDNACPVPNERYGVVKVLVSQNPNSTLPAVTSTPVLFPNLLTDGHDFIVPAELGAVSLQIFDTTGKLIVKEDMYNNSWSGKNAGAGLYLYRIRMSGTGPVFTGKLVLQK